MGLELKREMVVRKQASKAVTIPEPDLRMISVDVVGLSPLIVNRWSEKAQRQIEDTQAHAVKATKKPPRDPEAEFKASMYRLPNGGHGFPAAAFKKAAVSACRLIDGLAMTQARLLFVCPQDFVEIEAPTPKLPKGSEWPAMDARPVRLANGSADMRYRAAYWPWSCRLEVRYNAGATSAEQIVNLLALAGECIGIGELRPERGDNHGRFELGNGNGKSGSKSKRAK